MAGREEEMGREEKGGTRKTGRDRGVEKRVRRGGQVREKKTQNWFKTRKWDLTNHEVALCDSPGGWPCHDDRPNLRKE